MPTDFIPLRSTRFFSNFICDYLEQEPTLKPLYNRFPTLQNFREQIKEKCRSDSALASHRNILVKVLKQQYSKTQMSKLTQDHIDSIGLENTFTITTGHQLNLFTGPLYFLYKIVSAINLSRKLKDAYPDYNFVPVYWMASEDHDFEEINYFNFKGKKLQWNSVQTGAVGHFDTKGLDAVLRVVSSEFGPGKHAQQLKHWFEQAYVKHSNLADATRYLANQLFNAYGLVVLDADNPDLKRLFIPHMERELFEQTAFTKVSQTNHILEDLALKIQVNPRAINLFYIDNKIRERVVFENDVFKVNNTEIIWNKNELRKHLNTFPERFSPNVIMRPLYQEAILPNLCYIGGGGEMIYWLQLKSNFEAQGMVFPILLLRNSAVIKSVKQTKKQEALEISNLDLFMDSSTFINKRVRKISNIDIDFTEQITHLRQQFNELYQIAENTDASFEGAVSAQEKKQLNGIKYLEKRLLHAQKRKLKDQVERATALQEQLFPKGNLQERTVNFSELYLDYGEKLIPELVEKLDPLNGQFSVITL